MEHKVQAWEIYGNMIETFNCYARKDIIINVFHHPPLVHGVEGIDRSAFLYAFKYPWKIPFIKC
jgi:hypothetical protein